MGLVLQPDRETERRKREDKTSVVRKEEERQKGKEKGSRERINRNGRDEEIE